MQWCDLESALHGDLGGEGRHAGRSAGGFEADHHGLDGFVGLGVLFVEQLGIVANHPAAEGGAPQVGPLEALLQLRCGLSATHPASGTMGHGAQRLGLASAFHHPRRRPAAAEHRGEGASVGWGGSLAVQPDGCVTIPRGLHVIMDHVEPATHAIGAGVPHGVEGAPDQSPAVGPGVAHRPEQLAAIARLGLGVAQDLPCPGATDDAAEAP